MTEPTAAEVFRHDGSCLLPVGLTSRDLVEVSTDKESWSQPTMAGVLEWSCNNDVPIHWWRRPTTPPPSPDNGLLERLEALLAAASFECLQADGNDEDGYVIHDMPAASTVAYFQAGDATEEFAKLATEAVNALPGLIATIRSQAAALSAAETSEQKMVAAWGDLLAAFSRNWVWGIDPDAPIAAEVERLLSNVPTIHDALTLAERPMTKADVDRLVDERDALRAKLEAQASSYADTVTELRAAGEALDRLTAASGSALAQLARAREALEPFAKEAENYDRGDNGQPDFEDFPDHCQIDEINDLLVGHLRTAREALAALSTGEESARRF